MDGVGVRGGALVDFERLGVGFAGVAGADGFLNGDSSGSAVLTLFFGPSVLSKSFDFTLRFCGGGLRLALVFADKDGIIGAFLFKTRVDLLRDMNEQFLVGSR